MLHTTSTHQMPEPKEVISDRCYLLELPAELRNCIIELYIRKMYYTRGTGIYTRLNASGRLPLDQPDLAATNRQLRSETLDIFYSTVVFCIGPLDDVQSYPVQWLEGKAPYLHLIRDIQMMPCSVHAIWYHVYGARGQQAHYYPSDDGGALELCRMVRRRDGIHSSLQSLCDNVGTAGMGVEEHLRVVEIIRAAAPKRSCLQLCDKYGKDFDRMPGFQTMLA